jgi:hypothetical protein
LTQQLLGFSREDEALRPLGDTTAEFVVAEKGSA